MRVVGLILPSEEQVFACPHCGKNYKSDAALEKHIKDKHPEAVEQPGETDTEEKGGAPLW